VLACDVDELAVAATLRSAELNGVGPRLEVVHGSLDAVVPRLPPGAKADVLVANILAPVLVEMLAHGLAEPVRTGGAVVLAGILQEQADEVQRAATAAGLTSGAVRAEGDWVALVYRTSR
jgi:ribosomal protein L11 methyltransferase